MIVRTVVSLVAAALATVQAEHLYLSTAGGLTVFSIGESGEPVEVQEVALPGAGVFAFSPDGETLYAVAGKKKTPELVTFSRGGDGRLTQVHAAASGERAGDLSVDATGGFLAGSHYGDGKAFLWRLEGGVYRGAPVQELALEERAHAARFSPDNRWLLVPATSPNKVFINAFDAAAGALAPHDPPYADGPQQEGRARQPRHLVFHPHLPGVVYTTNEREAPGVCVWKWDAAAGALEVVQDIVTTPRGAEGVFTTATLHLVPGGRFLYVSNRNKEGGSTIVCFRVDPGDGSLELVGHTPCENVPRGFCISGDGRFLFVAGQLEDRLGAYAIDQESGALERVAQLAVGKRPSWLEAR